MASDAFNSTPQILVISTSPLVPMLIWELLMYLNSVIREGQSIYLLVCRQIKEGAGGLKIEET